MIKPKKSLGQNFIIDKNICRKITKLTKIENNEIIEIGPGTGFLTDEILKQKPKELTIIEKDKTLFLKLIKKYKKTKNIKIINFDALKYNYKEDPKQKTIISNLPYNISIKLIINWLKMKNQFNKLILMIQKEVAEKMDYKKIKKNRLNFFIEIASNYNIEFHVSRNVFYPKPKIMSSVIKIVPKKEIKINLDKLELFTKEIFRHKRKKLSNVLKIKKTELTNFFQPNLLEKRAEDLKTDDLLKIFNEFYNF